MGDGREERCHRWQLDRSLFTTLTYMTVSGDRTLHSTKKSRVLVRMELDRKWMWKWLAGRAQRRHALSGKVLRSAGCHNDNPDSFQRRETCVENFFQVQQLSTKLFTTSYITPGNHWTLLRGIGYEFLPLHLTLLRRDFLRLADGLFIKQAALF